MIYTLSCSSKITRQQQARGCEMERSLFLKILEYLSRNIWTKKLHDGPSSNAVSSDGTDLNKLYTRTTQRLWCQGCFTHHQIITVQKHIKPFILFDRKCPSFCMAVKDSAYASYGPSAHPPYLSISVPGSGFCTYSEQGLNLGIQFEKQTNNTALLLT